MVAVEAVELHEAVGDAVDSPAEVAHPEVAAVLEAVELRGSRDLGEEEVLVVEIWDTVRRDISSR